MTSAEMVAQVGYRMRDSSGGRYSSTVIYSTLNIAVKEIVRIADKKELSELIATITGKISTSTGITNYTDYSTLAKTNSTLFVQNAVRFSNGFAKYSSVKYPIEEISSEEFEQIRRSSLYSGSYTTPFLIDKGTYFYLYPAMISGQTIDVDYIREPVTITTDVNCDLNYKLHPLIVQCTELILKNEWANVEAVLTKYFHDKKEI